MSGKNLLGPIQDVPTMLYLIVQLLFCRTITIRKELGVIKVSEDDLININDNKPLIAILGLTVGDASFRAPCFISKVYASVHLKL